MTTEEGNGGPEGHGKGPTLMTSKDEAGRQRRKKPWCRSTEVEGRRGRQPRIDRLRAEGGGNAEAPGTEAEGHGEAIRTASGRRLNAGGRRRHYGEAGNGGRLRAEGGRRRAEEVETEVAVDRQPKSGEASVTKTEARKATELRRRPERRQ